MSEIVLSPSQVNNAHDCLRKWGFISLEKRPVEQHPSAALGTDTHKQLETYLRGGQLDYTRPSGYIAASGVQHLPAPKTPGMVLESKFKFQTRRGIWYKGYRDVLLPASSRQQGRPLIIDHKTTSNLGFIKTSEDLKTDPQAIIYAFSEPADATDLKWVYYRTKGARASVPVEITLSRQHVADEMERLEVLTTEPLVATIRLYKSGRLKALDLPYNPDTCDKYGGCPFKSVCQIGPAERLRSVINQGQRTVRDFQREQLMGIIDSLRNPASVVSAPPPQAPQAINPPPDTPAPTAEALPPVLDPAEAKPEKPKRLTGAARKAAEKKQQIDQKLTAAERTETLPGVNADTKPSIETGQFGAAAKPNMEEASRVLNAREGYTLYVDCAPDVALFTAEDLLYAPARQAVAEKSGVPDYRMIQFGAGPGYLAVAVEDLLKEFKGSHLVVSTQCQETHACLSVLVKYASVVVRATR